MCLFAWTISEHRLRLRARDRHFVVKSSQDQTVYVCALVFRSWTHSTARSSGELVTDSDAARRYEHYVELRAKCLLTALVVERQLAQCINKAAAYA